MEISKQFTLLWLVLDRPVHLKDTAVSARSDPNMGSMMEGDSARSPPFTPLGTFCKKTTNGLG